MQPDDAVADVFRFAAEIYFGVADGVRRVGSAAGPVDRLWIHFRWQNRQFPLDMAFFAVYIYIVLLIRELQSNIAGYV